MTNNVKTLIFEGAGWEEAESSIISGVGNCRIRTRLRNNDGKEIYLEIIGTETGKYTPNYLKNFKVAGFIDFCFENDCNEHSEFRKLEHIKPFEYTKENILKFVNENLNCSYENIEVTGMFDGYNVHGVHGEKRNYNLMNDFELNKERTAARSKAYNEIDLYYRQKLNEKYSIIHLMKMDDNSITIRCHASKESLNRAGLSENEREKTIIVNY